MSIVTKILGKTLTLAKISKTKTAEIAKDTGMQSVFEQHLASVENPELKLLLKRNSAVLLENASEINQKRIPSIIDDIIQKLELCEDSRIKEKVFEILKLAERKPQKEVFDSVKKAEQMLDAVNMAENKYCVIRKSTSFRLDDKIPEARGVNKLLYKKKGEKLDDFTRFSGMRDYIEEYHDDASITKYMWEKYFLPAVKRFRGKEDGQTVINRLKDIEQKFGTKIFIDSKELGTKEMLKFVKKEFDMQKKYSGGEASVTQYLHVSKYDWNFITDSCAGFCMTRASDGAKYIKAKGIENIDSLRHESEHFLDEVGLKTTKTAESVSFEDLSNIINKACSAKKSDKIKRILNHFSPVRIFKSLKNFIKKKKLEREENQEMKNAGISRGLRKYARSDERERRAVFVQGNMEAYSDKIKQRMINDGVPEFMTRMPQHTKDYHCKVMKQKYRNNTEAKRTLDKLNKVLDGKLYGVMDLFSIKTIKAINRELEHYKEGETTTQGKFIAKFVIRQCIPRAMSNLRKKVGQIITKKEAA